MPKRLTKQQKAYINNIPLDLSLPKTLKEAVIKRDYAAVKRLLKNGANPNEQDKNGVTPLHLATKDNRLYIVTLLIQKGANPLIKNKEGCNAYDYALISNSNVLISLFDKKRSNNNRNYYNFFNFNETFIEIKNENNENNDIQLNF